MDRVQLIDVLGFSMVSARLGRSRLAAPHDTETYDVVSWLFNEAEEAVTSDGNILAFLVTSVLALSSAIMRDWRWHDDVSDLPSVVGEDGLKYFYSLLPGGQQVEIYLPSGRLVVHHTTAAAARDPSQLADEVGVLVDDLYTTE